MKLATYNIDGLPEALDLRDLPWIFQPLVWIYKLIFKTTFVSLNDNVGRSKATELISEYILDKDFDLVGVQEDFNYHIELESDLRSYNFGTHQGAIDFSKIFSMVKWFRYKSDGLNFITKKRNIVVHQEEIIEWNDYCGYFNHCNDGLTRKGFRFYNITVDNKYDLDVYVIHTDASDKIDDKEDLEVRGKQFQQLSNYIINKESNNPIIVMGDFNTTTESFDLDNLNKNFVEPLMSRLGFTISECLPNNDLDRVFFINNGKSKYSLKMIKCGYDDINLSDHRPFVVEFEIL